MSDNVFTDPEFEKKLEKYFDGLGKKKAEGSTKIGFVLEALGFVIKHFPTIIRGVTLLSAADYHFGDKSGMTDEEMEAWEKKIEEQPVFNTVNTLVQNLVA